MYKVVVTKPAEEDLRKAVSYIANDLKNIIAAKNLLNEVETAIKSLSEMPKRYHIVDDELLAIQGIRMVQIKNYLAFYVVREETKSVTVLRFLYARRDWLNILKNT